VKKLVGLDWTLSFATNAETPRTRLVLIPRATPVTKQTVRLRIEDSVRIFILIDLGNMSFVLNTVFMQSLLIANL
jgi:hypothetical protein